MSSLMALVCLSPFFAVAALCIAVESEGGVIYRQTRVGRGNRDFKLLKFRTMRVNSDRQGLLTVGDRDVRITRTGYFLRRYKLDELPQLVNVLKGEMSIVGPRPEVRKYVDMYTPEQMRVLSVRPGLTDYASLAYVHESRLLAASADPELTYTQEVMPAKLALNLKYMETRTFCGDLKLIFKTIFAIFK